MPQPQQMQRRAIRSAESRAAVISKHERLTEFGGSLAWGAAGFVLGAVCWHVIGFWSFVGDVVLKGPEDRPAIEMPAAPALPTAQSTKPVSPIRATMAGVRSRPKADTPACSDVSPKSTGVLSRSCPPGLPPIAERPLLARADKLEMRAPGEPHRERELQAQRHAAPIAPPTPQWSTTVAAPRR